MGILDDAIREHLELKRQHGAAQSDLERLEQEAFGAAVRPGDPGYETGESPIPAPEEAVDPGEAPTTVAPAPDAEQEPAKAEAEPGSDPVEAPEAEIFDVEGDELDVAGMSTEDFAAAAGSASEPTPAERARQEHPHLDDTIDHPGPEPKSLSEELEEVAPEVGEEETSEPEDDVFESEGQAAPTEPVLDPESDEHAAPEPIQRPAAQDDPEDEDDESDEDDGDDADLLEETPEFLKDAPEGEDLWFEQGPPKDFDFD